MLSEDMVLVVGPDPAEVKVAIVDSCSSGSMTRAKGGRRTADFPFRYFYIVFSAGWVPDSQPTASEAAPACAGARSLVTFFEL